MPLTVAPQNAKVSELSAREAPETTVLVAVGSPKVREALVAMLGAIEGFRVVSEADSADAAIEAARRQRPRLALIEPELSNCGGWWVIQQIRTEQLACVVVALGQRADGTLAQMVGAQSYVQIGVSPRDLLSTLEAAIAYRTPPLSGSAELASASELSGGAEAEDHLLPDTNAVLDKPAFIDF
jgi:DNA-binding NarL/FixJ family response regulator